MVNETEEKQPRLVLAILVAIAMGLIGCALFILLYYIGFIAWIAGFAIVLAAGWGYKKFNLKMDVKGYVIVAVISVAEVLLSLFIGLVIDCVQIFEVSFGEGFSLLVELINDYPEIKSGVISDAIFSVLSIVVGFIIFVSSERRQNRIKKHEEETAKQNEIDQNSDSDRFSDSSSDTTETTDEVDDASDDEDSSEDEYASEDEENDDDDDHVQPGMEQ